MIILVMTMVKSKKTQQQMLHKNLLLSHCKSILFFVGVLFSAVWLFLAYTFWVDSFWSPQDNNAEANHDGFSQKTVPALISEPLINFLNHQEGFIIDSNKPQNAALSKLYSHRRPLDPRGWYWQSMFSEGIDEDYSEHSLLTAVALSKNKVSWLKNYFSEYINRGRLIEAAKIAQLIVEGRPSEFDRYFYFLVRLLDDSEMLVNFIPQKSPKDFGHDESRYDDTYYFRRAIRMAIRLDDPDLASKVWRRMPKVPQTLDGFVDSYIAYLAKTQDWQGLKRIVDDMYGVSIVDGEVHNGDFAANIKESTHCWYVKPNDFVKVGVEEKDNDAKLLVEFLGESNISYASAMCFLGVRSGKKYRLSANWQGSKITTFSGPFLEISRPGERYKRLASIKPRSGSWDEIDFSLDFDVPEDTHVITIKIRRNRTSMLDNKITGKVWFDDFRLEQIENLDNDG